MRHLFLKLIVFVLISITFPVIAIQIEFHSFENPQQERLYLDLTAELRCVKCQNQNLAESNAELARDMRDKTYTMVIEGKSREDIVNYMTARYGDFVLYNPPLKFKTLLLWAGPPILLLLSLFMILKYIRNQPKKVVEQLSETERESMRNILKSNSSNES